MTTPRPPMKTVDQMDHHPTSEQLVDILCTQTQNSNPLFFRILVGFYFCMAASMMRTQIKTIDRGTIPINMYALNLSKSGSGKGHSTNIMEKQVLNQFRENFLEQAFPVAAEDNIPDIAVRRAKRKGTDPDKEEAAVIKEFESLGPLVFSFDSATPAAIKQMRTKLQIANAGSMNLIIDEIGSNLVGNIDALTTYLELFDMGELKQKLVMNTADRARSEDLAGSTPANMMMFGTPSKLLNGSKTEEELYSLFDTGYARRCLFGYSQAINRTLEMTPEEILDASLNNNSNAYLEQLSDRLGMLADPINMGRELLMSRDVSLLLIEYRQNCERIANQLPEHEEMKKSEISHRYWKALKLAGAYAFIDEAVEVNEDHLYNAIKLVEESGEAFNRLLNRDRPYVKLAKYLADINRDVTQADLVEDLPFYKGSKGQKDEMMQLAIAHGYQNNIIIKRLYRDSIEFLRGEALKETDLNEMIFSYSDEWVEGYQNERQPWDQLHVLMNQPDMHWVNHHLKNGYRNEENAIGGFNMVVIDMDDGTPMHIAQELLKDYKFLMYTTKRHTEDHNRFRIVLPTSHELKLDAKDFKEFMANIYQWLPFDADAATNQRARKWQTHDGDHVYNDGVLLDILPFIPKTTKNDERKKKIDSQQSLDNLERWVINNTGDGNRNNQLLRYAMILVDAGFEYDPIRSKVVELNSKLEGSLDEIEIQNTIMVTVAKAIAKRAP